MTVQDLPTSLPDSLYQFFWDVDPAKVDPSKNPTYVINRLLDKGDLEAARWVLRHFSRELIAETLRTKRDFTFWTALFWARYIGIPREEVKCLQEPYYSLRKTFWPY